MAIEEVIRRAAAAGLLLAVAGFAAAQSEEIVTAKRGGYTISGLAMHQGDGPFKHGVVLFPGHPGTMRIEAGADGTPKFEQRGNFLIRTRRFWADAETLVLSVDAPSDQWANFPQYFRATARYGEDVAALLGAATQKFGVQEWTFVGTSEGSISAYYAAAMNPKLAQRLILTSTLFDSTKNGPGMGTADLSRLPAQTLWVHHADDPCPYTSYRAAQDYARRSGKPLVTVRGGGGWKGDACQAFTAHGYRGVERETVEAMRSWAKTGNAPADVGR